MSWLKSISMRIVGLPKAAGGDDSHDRKTRCLTAEEAEAYRRRPQAESKCSLKFMPVNARYRYTAWVDESESDGLVAGVLDIPGFPILLQPSSDLDGWALLVDALDREVQKYLDLCEKLGWPPAQRDPVADRRLNYASPVEKAAVAAARELAIECAAEVGDTNMGARLAGEIVARKLYAL